MSQITERKIEIVRKWWDMCRDCAITYIIARQNGYMIIDSTGYHNMCIIRHGNNIIYIDREKMGIVRINCPHKSVMPLTLYKDEYYLSHGSSLRKIPHSTIELSEDYNFISPVNLISIPEIGGALWIRDTEAPYNNYLIYFNPGALIDEDQNYTANTYMLSNGDAVRVVWSQTSKKYAAINQLGKLVPVNVLVSPDRTFRTSHYQVQIKDYKATCTRLSGGRTKPAPRIVDDE